MIALNMVEKQVIVLSDSDHFVEEVVVALFAGGPTTKRIFFLGFYCGEFLSKFLCCFLVRY